MAAPGHDPSSSADTDRVIFLSQWHMIEAAAVHNLLQRRIEAGATSIDATRLPRQQRRVAAASNSGSRQRCARRIQQRKQELLASMAHPRPAQEDPLFHTLPASLLWRVSRSDVRERAGVAAAIRSGSAQFAMEEAVFRQAADRVEANRVGRILNTEGPPKFVDGSKAEAVFRQAASSSADTVETGRQSASIFWDEAEEDDYWFQTEDLAARPPQDDDEAPVVNPWLEFLMARASPETAAVLRIIHARTNVFNEIGAHANAYNQLAAHAQTRTEASSRARPSAPVINSTIFAGGTEEEDGTDWYKSIACDAQRLEQMEEPEIQEMPSPLRLAEAPAPTKEEEKHCGGHKRRELTLEDYCKVWGLHPSELDPDEPGPSTKRRIRVPPLADDEVAKFDCGICLETLPILDLFHGMQCDHKFCAHCMTTYIEGRIRDGVVSILCPDPACKEAAGEGNNNGGVLNLEHCKKSIDYGAFCSWGARLTEKAIPVDQRVYCPNPRCGLMLMLERTLGADKAPCKTSCPACNHLMCTACGLGWVIDGRDDDHHNCDEGKGAALVKELVAARHWKQCPSCKMVVERIMGCNAMHCRCGCLFCYRCGLLMEAGLEQGTELCQCRDNGNLYHVHIPHPQPGAQTNPNLN